MNDQVIRLVDRLLGEQTGRPFAVRDPHRGVIYFMQRDPSRSDSGATVLRPISRLQQKNASVPPKKPASAEDEFMPEEEEVTVESIREEIEQIVDDPDIEDEALDFIETQIGRYNFPKNWIRDRPFYVGLIKELDHGDEILAEIDGLAEEGATWNDMRRTSVIELHKPKKKR